LKKRFVSIAALFVVAAMMLALVAACRNEPESDNVMPDYVYIPEFISLPEGISRISGVVYNGNTVFISAMHRDEETFSEVAILYALDLSTNVATQLTNYSTNMPAPDAQGWVSVSLSVDGEGNLWTFETGSFWRLNIPDNFDGEEHERWEFFEDLGTLNSIRKLDSTGAEVSTLSLDAMAQGTNWFQINSFVIGDDGNIYISAQGDSPAFGDNNAALFVLDSSANVLFSIASDGWDDRVLRLSDGSVAHFGWVQDVEFGSVRTLRPIDLATQNFGSGIELPGNFWQIFSGNDDFDILFVESGNLYGFSIGSEEPEFLLNWIDSDVLTGGNEVVSLLSDGRVLTATEQWGRRHTDTPLIEVVLLTRTPSADLPERTILTLATLWMNPDLQNSVVEFNRTSTTHRIRVTDYSQFNTDEDWTAGLTRLSTEIIAGRVPDILSVSELPLRQYVARGLLVDLYELIDADPELSRNSFVDGAFEAAEMDGGLFQIFPSFSVHTILGHPSVLGPEPGWNMDEFKAVLAANPNADRPLGAWFTRNAFLMDVVSLNMDQYVNWATGEVNFDTIEFAQLLEFAKTFPEEFDFGGDGFMTRDDETTLIPQGRQIMVQLSVSEFQWLQMYSAMFDGEIVFKGFPAENRNGHSISPNGGLSITTAASDKDGAWSFIRNFLTEDFQNENHSWGFPTNQAALDRVIEQAMTPQEGEHSMGWGNLMVTLTPTTQAEVDQVMELIRSTSGISGRDERLMYIVSEGANDFFSGRGSAQDAARVIQSRVSIYVAEQS